MPTGLGLSLNVFVGTVVDLSPSRKLRNSTGITDIAIPDRFYQILAFEFDGEIVVGAFLFPHPERKSDLGSFELLDYLVSVDEVEEAVELDFFHQLPDDLEDKIESLVEESRWRIFIED